MQTSMGRILKGSNYFFAISKGGGGGEEGEMVESGLIWLAFFQCTVRNTTYVVELPKRHKLDNVSDSHLSGQSS